MVHKCSCISLPSKCGRRGQQLNSWPRAQQNVTATPQQVGCRFIWTVQFSNANCSSPDVLICFLNSQLVIISCSCTAGIKSLRFTAPERKQNVFASWACSRIFAFSARASICKQHTVEWVYWLRLQTARIINIFSNPTVCKLFMPTVSLRAIWKGTPHLF